ncbi:MAG: amidohydrolase [Lachnospiraceae bacterium]|nr:amidohydrolase [Lachnospiraceae bacterium]
MKIRLYNARILTMEEDRPIFLGEIWVEDDRIVYVGEKKEPEDRKKAHSFDKEIDCEENLLMPGFKNAHTHSGMTFLRSYADDLPLQKWLTDKVFPMEKKLTGEDIYHFAKLAILEYLSSGITAVFDMYLMPEIMAHAAIDMGMRCVLTSGLNNFTSSIGVVTEEYEKWNHFSPLITYQLGFHAEYTCSKNLLVQMASLAHKFRAPVYAHISETAAEVTNCKKKYGMTPPMFLDCLGMFEYGGGGFHCVHMRPEDFDVFHKRSLYVITNPASNVKLASGMAPISQFLEKGITVAIGTDGAASNNSLDMFKEMFLTTGLAKLREKNASAVEAEKVLRMATVNGAAAMRLTDADVLAEGKLADMILIDLQKPNMRPIHNIEKNLVYSGSKQNVKFTMVGGRILYQDGNYYVGEEPMHIYREVERSLARIMQ